MSRRQFITLLGGAAAWPLAAYAQQPQRIPQIGVLMGVAESDPGGQARIAAFQQGLADLGWTVGRNIHLEYRWAAGDIDRIRAYAAELVALAPEMLVGNGTPALTALRDATRSIPIVFVVVNDPVGQGFIVGKGLDQPVRDVRRGADIQIFLCGDHNHGQLMLAIVLLLADARHISIPLIRGGSCSNMASDGRSFAMSARASSMSEKNLA